MVFSISCNILHDLYTELGTIYHAGFRTNTLSQLQESFQQRKDDFLPFGRNLNHGNWLLLSRSIALFGAKTATAPRAGLVLGGKNVLLMLASAPNGNSHKMF